MDMAQGRKWTEEDLLKLKILYPNMNNAELARTLGRTKRAIQHKAIEFSLIKTSRFFTECSVKGLISQGNRPWHKEELEQLKSLYPSFPTREAATRLNRSEQAIMHKAHALKLRKKFRVGMYGNNYKHLGKGKEEEAISHLQSKGWKLLSKGGYQTPEDAIMERNGAVYAINIKFGKKFTESKENLERLFSIGHKVGIVYFTDQNQYYFMEIETL